MYIRLECVGLIIRPDWFTLLPLRALDLPFAKLVLLSSTDPLLPTMSSDDDTAEVFGWHGRGPAWQPYDAQSSYSIAIRASAVSSRGQFADGLMCLSLAFSSMNE